MAIGNIEEEKLEGPQPPCLIFPHRGGRGCSLMNLFDDNCGAGSSREVEVNDHHLQVLLQLEQEKKEAKNKLVFKGCSHGWIVAVGKGPDIYLINPTLDLLQKLPPITTFGKQVLDYSSDRERVGKEYRCVMIRHGELPYHECPPNCYVQHDVIFRSWEDMRGLFVQKVVLSSSSPSAPNTIAMSICGEFRELGFCKPGVDDCWTVITSNVSDVIFTRDQLYVATFVGNVFTVSPSDLLSYSSSSTSDYPHTLLKNCYRLPMELKKITEAGGDNYLGGTPTKFYLVESPAGDLLLVSRHHSDNVEIQKTTHFEVFNLFNLNSSSTSTSTTPKSSAEQVESLGDYALFLGYNDSWCVPSANFPANCPGLKSNCIYFTDDDFERQSEEDMLFALDLDFGIFDYKNKAVNCFNKKNI